MFIRTLNKITKQIKRQKKGDSWSSTSVTICDTQSCLDEEQTAT